MYLFEIVWCFILQPDLGNVSDDDLRMKVDDAHALNIDNVQKSDSGIYRCRGRNMLGDTVTTVNLKVGKHCKVKTTAPTHLEFIPGKSIEFSAEIDVRTLCIRLIKLTIYFRISRY